MSYSSQKNYIFQWGYTDTEFQVKEEKNYTDIKLWTTGGGYFEEEIRLIIEDSMKKLKIWESDISNLGISWVYLRDNEDNTVSLIDDYGELISLNWETKFSRISSWGQGLITFDAGKGHFVTKTFKDARSNKRKEYNWDETEKFFWDNEIRMGNVSFDEFLRVSTEILKSLWKLDDAWYLIKREEWMYELENDTDDKKSMRRLFFDNSFEQCPLGKSNIDELREEWVELKANKDWTVFLVDKDENLDTYRGALENYYKINNDERLIPLIWETKFRRISSKKGYITVDMGERYFVTTTYSDAISDETENKIIGVNVNFDEFLEASTRILESIWGLNGVWHFIGSEEWIYILKKYNDDGESIKIERLFFRSDDFSPCHLGMSDVDNLWEKWVELKANEDWTVYLINNSDWKEICLWKKYSWKKISKMQKLYKIFWKKIGEVDKIDKADIILSPKEWVISYVEGYFDWKMSMTTISLEDIMNWNYENKVVASKIPNLSIKEISYLSEKISSAWYKWNLSFIEDKKLYELLNGEEIIYFDWSWKEVESNDDKTT